MHSYLQVKMSGLASFLRLDRHDEPLYVWGRLSTLPLRNREYINHHATGVVNDTGEVQGPRVANKPSVRV
jgi:hypothetical protein